MIRYVLISFASVVLLSACGGSKKTAGKSDYPEFVWDDERKPVRVSRSEKRSIENEEPEKPAVKRVESDLNLVVESWLGTPYKWGGTTKEGADCSGFTLRVYEEAFHTQLPGRRAEDFFQLVEVVEEGEAQPGDLVFFKINNKRINHVGVYLGNRRFAHASTSKGVIVSSLNEAYYRKYFFKVGRVLEE